LAENGIHGSSLRVCFNPKSNINSDLLVRTSGCVQGKAVRWQVLQRVQHPLHPIDITSCHIETFAGLSQLSIIRKTGAIVYREAETFNRKQAANDWIVNRLDRKPAGS
jgi:hypothetical protein